MKISLIVAVGIHNQIGINGKLPWYSKKDLEYFREKTMNHMVVMGRKTFEGLPKKLKGRTIIVLSRTQKNIEDVLIASSIQEVMNLAKQGNESELFIAGGESIYKQFIDMSGKIYLSKINYDGDADTYFPVIDETKWEKAQENKFRDGIWINYVKKTDDSLF